MIAMPGFALSRVPAPLAEARAPLAQAMRAVIDRLEPLHSRLCPRQVLGARIGLLAGDILGLSLPRADKRLLTMVETDGCFTDGVIEATGCRVGRRTLRVLDYGKTAATFVDVETGDAVRIRPRADIRSLAVAAVPNAETPWHAMLDAYQWLPSTDLLEVQTGVLPEPLTALLGRPGIHIPCAGCGEEIMNDREVMIGSEPWCRGCARP